MKLVLALLFLIIVVAGCEFSTIETPLSVDIPDSTGCDKSIKVIAYTDNGKYFCEGFGADCECRTTEEILSGLG